MKTSEYMTFRGGKLPVYRFNTCVVGSGAAGLNCADTLDALGNKSTALVTEGFNMGTSRNTGSDKQTYYKLTLSGASDDSVRSLAETLYAGGAMHGDIALAEAAGSARAFFKLCQLGVPFPYNEYGEYAGYKTDHDPRARATSCGPLTSRYMTERLADSVRARGIPVFDGYRAVEILTEGNAVRGLLTVCPELASQEDPDGLAVFACENLVWATGGPSAIYAATVYPESQTCAHGTAFRAGAEGVNLGESQYGIASVKFRWNLSGTYQQVIPRYFSTDSDGGDAREFLAPSFESAGDMFDSIFLKGYQWPFDPRKAVSGSSRVDLAVYRERMSGRRVFLDFTRDPDGFGLSLLGAEARGYLERSSALLGTPIERLAKMNAPAIELYASHGIDLTSESLEIDVCAQHNNGGLAGDAWYESTSLHGFFPVGEANGVFGVYRPGGSALNSTQVSSYRAALRITDDLKRLGGPDSRVPDALPELTLPPALSCRRTSRGEETLIPELLEKRLTCGRRMTRVGAFIRNLPDIEAAIKDCRRELDSFADENEYSGPRSLVELAINHDVLLTQYVYLSAIAEYIRGGGLSRGSYLVNGSAEPDTAHTGELLYARLRGDKVEYRREAARPIPDSEQWFETVYNSFLKK